MIAPAEGLLAKLFTFLSKVLAALTFLIFDLFTFGSKSAFNNFNPDFKHLVLPKLGSDTKVVQTRNLDTKVAILNKSMENTNIPFYSIKILLNPLR